MYAEPESTEINRATPFPLKPIDVAERSNRGAIVVEQLLAAARRLPETVANVHLDIDLTSLGDRNLGEGGSEALPAAIATNWTRLALSGLSAAAYARIKRIADKRHGWRGGRSQGLKGESLGNFMKFWNLVRRETTEPEFTLAPNGFLHVEWHKNWQRHVDLTFDVNGLVYFGLFDVRAVNEGVESVKAIADYLSSRNSRPLRWTG